MTDSNKILHVYIGTAGEDFPTKDNSVWYPEVGGDGIPKNPTVFQSLAKELYDAGKPVVTYSYLLLRELENLGGAYPKTVRFHCNGDSDDSLVLNNPVIECPVDCYRRMLDISLG